MVNKLTGSLSILSKYYDILTKLVNNKILTMDEKLLLFYDRFNKINFRKSSVKEYIRKIMFYYRKEEYKFKYLLRFNNIKFTKQFMLRLVLLVQDIYNKRV